MTTNPIFDTDSVVWQPDTSVPVKEVPEPRLQVNNNDLPRGGLTALHNGTQGLWVEPHPMWPEGVPRLRRYNATEPGQRYGDTVNIFNPDAYDKKAIFSLCGIIHGYSVDSQLINGHGWHILRFGTRDQMQEVARVATPHSDGCDRQIPLTLSTAVILDVPAGAGMRDRRIDNAGALVQSVLANPDAPAVVVARFTQYYESALSSQASSTSTGNDLLWSYLMA